MRTIKLKITNLNIVKHYFGFIMQIVISSIMFFLGLFNLFMFTGTTLLFVLLNSFSIPLLRSYLLEDKYKILKISDNKIEFVNLKNNEIKYLDFSEIDFVLFVKPLYNKGSLSFGEFNFMRIYFNDKQTLTITSLMYGDGLEEIIHEFGVIKVVRVKSIYCSLD